MSSGTWDARLYLTEARGEHTTPGKQSQHEEITLLWVVRWFGVSCWFENEDVSGLAEITQMRRGQNQHQPTTNGALHAPDNFHIEFHTSRGRFRFSGHGIMFTALIV
ncbi:hypothetical protein RRG08_016787 [Elysia crispata]|uniref:Uncharacterized protein n=1 Tax=Elysia crispata TaxID=231223 RepID=A0AAE0ZZS7_9GAST|nr:hypothetical protein RRG08_016787 [Elysia crispata]